MIRPILAYALPAFLAGLSIAAPPQDRGGRAGNDPFGPGPQHEWLAEDAGTWTIRAKIWQPGAEAPIEVDGRSTMEMRWGRYLQEEFEVGEGPLAMRGIGIKGYDAKAGEFVAAYCLNTGTSISVTTGSRSEDGGTLVFVGGDGADREGEAARSRTVITREGDDRRVLRYFTTRGDGSERRSFELTYTRAE